MDLGQALQVSASGLRAQSGRIKAITENIANVDSIIGQDGQEPFRRQLVFLEAVQTASGATEVRLDRVEQDFKTPFKKEYDPQHPFADPQGFVNKPNIDPIAESADLREAARSYEANLSAIETTKTMLLRTVDVLR